MLMHDAALSMTLHSVPVLGVLPHDDLSLQPGQLSRMSDLFPLGSTALQ